MNETPRPSAGSNILARLIVLVGVLVFRSLVLAQEGPGPAVPDLRISPEERMKVFTKLWDSVNKRYFDPQFDGVNWLAVKEKYRRQAEATENKVQLYGVLQRMLGELQSSHLQLYLDVHFGTGLYAQPGPRQNPVSVEGQWVMSSIDDGSPAQLAGVQIGWILTQWDGKPYGRDLDTTCDLDRKVRLRFIDLRGQERILDVACRVYTRAARSPVKAVQTLNGGALYLRFTSFSGDIYKWLADQVSRNSSATAIVVDLRHNGGGEFAVVEKCLRPFFQQSAVFGEVRNRDGKLSAILKVPANRMAYSGPVFVLVDEATGSGAEVFAAGIQESRRGIVIGRRSVGAVRNAKEFKLSSGFTVDIPHSDYTTAAGTHLEGRGVIPDEPVKLTMKDFLENRDPDLERLKELLRKNRD